MVYGNMFIESVSNKKSGGGGEWGIGGRTKYCWAKNTTFNNYNINIECVKSWSQGCSEALTLLKTVLKCGKDYPSTQFFKEEGRGVAFLNKIYFKYRSISKFNMHCSLKFSSVQKEIIANTILFSLSLCSVIEYGVNRSWSSVKTTSGGNISWT